MYPLVEFINELYCYLTGNKNITRNIIRRHSRKLDALGDLSFPIYINNWTGIIKEYEESSSNDTFSTIFDYNNSGCDTEKHMEMLLTISANWNFQIQKYTLKNENNIQLFLLRSNVIDSILKLIQNEGDTYGFLTKCFYGKIIISTNEMTSNLDDITLTKFRLITIKSVATKILYNLTENFNTIEETIFLCNHSEKMNKKHIICGPVKGIPVKTTDLIKKRALNMQLMAQHKYGVQLKEGWQTYFANLGKACVILEMLQHKVHKSIKINLNNVESIHKEPSFIFYNCARVYALLKEFNERIDNKIYPKLPHIDEIDFSLLNQAEEWELIYVYIVQFPDMLADCVCGIKTRTLNLQNLISFLSNMSSIFSVYYRRVKILVNPKHHTLPVLYARIYLIKAIQQIFLTIFHLLDIEPIKEM